MPGEEHVYLEIGGRRISVKPGEQTLGRSHRCGVILEDRSASRVHAMVSWAHGRLTLQDLNSSNGSYLNGELLQGEAELRDGDEISLGEARLRVRRVPGTHAERIPVKELSAAIDEHFSDEHSPSRNRPQGDDRLSRSEVISAGEVMATGELLAAEAESELKTGIYRQPSFSDTRPVLREEAPSFPTSELTGSIPDTDEERFGRELLPPIEFASEPPLPLTGSSLAGAEEAFVEEQEEPALHLSETRPVAADFGSRLAAGLFDFVFTAALALAISYLRGGTVSEEGRSLALWFGLTFSAIAALASWVIWGATPGQRMVGLRVCDAGGDSPIGVLQALRRLVGFSLSVVTAGLGFLMVLFHPDGLALQDLLSGTRVVRR